MSQWDDDLDMGIKKFGEEDLDDIFEEEWEDEEGLEVSDQLRRVQQQAQNLGSFGEVLGKKYRKRRQV